MKWLIVADSGCILKKLKSDSVDYKSVPLTIRVGDTEYVDDENLSPDELMDAVYAYDGKTGSACPAPEAYKSTFEGYDNIIVFTLTSGLSGSYNSAVIAKDMELEEHPEKNIEICDTLSAGPTIAMMVKYAVALIEKGLSFEDVRAELKKGLPKIKLSFILDHLDNFVKNGRVNKFVAATVGVLGIRIVGIASQTGTLEIRHKARNFNIAINKLISDMESFGFCGKLVTLSHYAAEEAAAKIKETILKKYPNCVIDIMPNNGLCSYYAEKGGVLVGYMTE